MTELKEGATVIIGPTRGMFARRPLQFGIVVAQHRAEESVQVLWADGVTAALEGNAAVALQVVTDASADALSLLGCTMRPQAGPAKQMGKRGEGPVVAVYAVGGQDHIVVETALGLILSGPRVDFTLVPNR